MARLPGSKAADLSILAFIRFVQAATWSMPVIGIMFLLPFFEPKEVHKLPYFHGLLDGLTVLASGFLAYVSYRSYIKTKSYFIYYISLAYAAYAVFHTPHTLLSPWADVFPNLFNIYDPFSRLIMMAFLLIGVMSLEEGRLTSSRESFHRRMIWIIGGLVAVGSLAIAFKENSHLLVILDYVGLILAVTSLVVIWALGIPTRLMAFHFTAQAYFAQACLASLISTPWNLMWWYGHAITSVAFLVLGYVVATVYNEGRSFENIYDETIYFKTKIGELSRRNTELEDEVKIRERKQMEATQMRIAAEQSNRLKDEFLATLSHELRTPLHVILGYAEILTEMDVDLEERIDAAKAIQRNVLIQTGLVDQLLDISKIITGKLILNKEPVNMHQLITETIAAFEADSGRERPHLSFKSTHAHLMVEGDRQRLKQVISIAISNAIKFTPSTGSIEVTAEQDHQTVVIRIKDTGEGIDPHFLPRIFDKFSQQDGSLTRRHGGLGLNLSILQHLVLFHGGTIDVTSEGLGRGSEFVIRLPAAKKVPKGLATNSAPSEISTLPLSGVEVLLVDDAPDVLRLASTILEKSGARVRTATNAHEAMLELDRGWPRLLISDIGMPGEDGYSLMRRIRARPETQAKKIPAAALTAFASESDKLMALSSGFQMHIPKPIQISHFVKSISSLLSAH